MNNPELDRLIGRFRSAMRGTLLAWGAARCATAVLALIAGAVLCDYFIRFSSTGSRFMALVACLAGAAVMIYLDLILPLRGRWSDEDVLNILDGMVPGSRESLLNLAELTARSGEVVEARSERGREILELAIAELEEFVRKAEMPGLRKPRAIRFWQGAAGVLVLLFILAGLIVPDKLGTGLARLFLPFAHIRWPQRTYLVVLQPSERTTVAPQGAPYTVRAKIEGEVPDEVLLVYTTPSAKREISESMTIKESKEGPECAFTFPELTERIDFRLIGGDDQTTDYTLQVLQRPTLTKIVAAYVFPPYSRVPPKRVESGQISGLEGTKVTISFTASKDLSKAAVILGDAPPKDLPLDGPRAFMLRDLVLTKDMTYEIKLTDVDGLTEAHPEKYSIRVVPDEPPVARIVEPTGDLSLTPGGRAKINFRVTDDFGLTEVKFMYKVGDKGEPRELTDRITGPIMQTGKESVRDFVWDLQKMDLQPPTFVTYYVTAKDCNPTGRGVSQSPAMRIDILTPLEFQTRAVLAAKRIVTEARLAEQNQRWSAIDAGRWVSGAEKSPEKAAALLEQALAEQEAAARAARALDRLYTALMADIESNRMQGEFFDRRMKQINDLIRKAVDVRIPVLEKALDDAKPKSAAEEQPEARMNKMRKALAAIARDQKLAAVGFREILDQILDWNDLQGVLVQTRHLEKEQGEIITAAERETKAYIGKEIQDLTDEQARGLERISQRQKALGEAESALEEELQKLIASASTEGRRKVFDALFNTFKGLKDNMINNKMRRGGEAIGDNRTHEVLPDLVVVTRALKFINIGLLDAGRDVPPVKSEAEAMKVALADERGKPPETTQVAMAPSRQIEIDLKPGEVSIPDEARVETVERYLQDLGDAMQVLLDRTAYYEKRTATPMPGRYQRLHLGWLGMRHKLNVEAADKAAELAAKSDFKELPERLALIRREVEDVLRLINAKEVGRDTQELEADIVAATKNLRRFLHERRENIQRMNDRAEKKGKDDFGRDFVVAGPDMDAAVKAMEHLGWARVLQADAARKIRHLLPRAEGMAPPSHVVREIAGKAIESAEAAQAEVVRRIEEAARILGTISSEQAKAAVAAKVGPAVSADAARAILDAVKARKGDRALAEKAGQTEAALRQTLTVMADLVEERVRVETAAKEPPPPEVGPSEALADPSKITPEKLAELRAQFLKDRRPEAIMKRVEENKELPPAVRDRLLSTLKGKFDPKYEMLQSAYFLEILREEKRP